MTAPKNVTLRKAEVHDADGIARVQVESWRSTYNGIVPDAYLASLDREKLAVLWAGECAKSSVSLFVAEDATGVIGFICGGPIREAVAHHDAELYAVYLLHERQHAGTGRTMCHQLASTLRAKGFQSMLVWVLEDNPSVAFYRRLGGVQIAQKLIEIGGVQLSELAFGWNALDQLE